MLVLICCTVSTIVLTPTMHIRVFLSKCCYAILPVHVTSSSVITYQAVKVLLCIRFQTLSSIDVLYWLILLVDHIQFKISTKTG